MQTGPGHNVAAYFTDVPNLSTKQAFALDDHGLGNSIADETHTAPALLARSPFRACRFIFPVDRFIGDLRGHSRNLYVTKIHAANKFRSLEPSAVPGHTSTGGSRQCGGKEYYCLPGVTRRSR